MIFFPKSTMGSFAAKYKSHGETDSSVSPIPFDFTGTGKQSLREKLTLQRSAKEFVLAYHTKQALGEGITGRVMKVVDQHGMERAEKMSYGYDRANRAQIRELRTELSLLRALDHPTVVRLIEHYEDPPSAVQFVIDLCKGGNLASASAKARLNKSEGRIAYVVYQLFLAVKYIHDRGIAHRDIKEENVMFVSADTDSLYVQLIDFGLSSFVGVQQTSEMPGTVRRLRTFCGTLPYMSPEVLQANYDLQADMWSMGVLVFELLTGSLPFHGNTDRALIKQIRKAKIDYTTAQWAKLSPSALELVQHLLVVPTTKRWSADLALRSAWFNECKGKLEDTFVQENLQEKLQQSILSFAKYNRFRQMSMLVLAHFSPPLSSAVEQIQKSFMVLDVDYSGTLSIDEVALMMEDADGSLFAKLDYDGLGELSWTNFLAMTMEAFVPIDQTAWAKAFDYLSLERRHVKTSRLVDLLVRSPTRNGSDEEERQHVARCIEKCDMDHDGFIEKDEFLRLVLDC
jgi:calcium-dependent protein kinase